MNQVQREYFFRKEKLYKVMLKMCVPSVITILVMIIYNMADLFFVGMTNNPTLVTAVSLSMPVFTILQAIGSIIGMGGCSAAAIAYGNNNLEKVRKISSFCFYACIFFGILFGTIVLLGREQILDLLGASEAARPFVSTYITIISLGAPFILFSNVFANVIRSNGSATVSMLGNGIGTISNIILDPIFILALNMGVGGAAIATVLGNMISSVYLAYQVMKKDSGLSLLPRDFTINKDISLHVLSLGWASGISTALNSIALILFNRVLGTYGDNAIASMGVASKAGMLISMLQMGITLGLQPLIAYNYGARDLPRIKEILKKLAIFVILLGSFLTLTCFLFRDYIVAAFIDNSEIIELGSFMILATISAGPIIGINQLCTNFLQATNRAFFAVITSTLRQGIIFVPLLFTLKNYIGINGIVFTQPISDYLSTIVALCFLFTQYRKLKKECNEISTC
jgi:putative MATE family efflux protein